MGEFLANVKSASESGITMNSHLKHGAPPGTRLKNRVLITSTGIEGIDSLMVTGTRQDISLTDWRIKDGGAQDTMLMVIDEPDEAHFSSAIHRCYIAEGLIEGQNLFFASPRTSYYEETLEKLPTVAQSSNDNVHSKPTHTDIMSAASSPGEDFKIAWRYSTLKETKPDHGRAKFDLSKRMERASIVDFSDRFTMYRLVEGKASYGELWKQLHDTLTTAAGCERAFTRILITGLGSPLWTDPHNFRRFLIHLRAYTRSRPCIAFLSTDSSLMDAASQTTLLKNCDAYFQLEALSEERRREMSAFQKFDGRFIVKKLLSPFSVAPFPLEYTDLVFNLTRHTFEINVFHLPPAIDREGTSDKSAVNSCQRVREEF